MGIRARIILNTVNILILLGLVTSISFSGCMENKVSAADDINTSILLINNADSKYNNVLGLLQDGLYSSARITLEASKMDYEESLHILENAATDYEEEKQEIEYYKTIGSISLDKIAVLESLISCMEHFEKAVAYMDSNDFESIRKELRLAKENLDDSQVPLKSASTKIDTIDLKAVPIQDKSNIIMTKNELNQSEKMNLELGELLLGFHPFVNGFENIMNASEFIEEEEWDKAALEIQEASLEFSESTEKFEALKDSEFSEISVSAITIYSCLTEMKELLVHLENGCNYADEGKDTKATAEFNLALEASEALYSF
jgi:hypothetical protein